MQWELYGTHGKHNGLVFQINQVSNRNRTFQEGNSQFRNTTTRVTTTTTRRQRRTGVNTRVVAQIDRRVIR